jgi:Neocarzinostatin family
MTARKSRIGFALALLSGLMLVGAPAAAAAPAAAVTVNPSTGLEEGGSVGVTYTGFEPNAPIEVKQCVLTSINPHAPRMWCHPTPVHTVSDSRGAGSVTYPNLVRRIHDPLFDKTFECRSDVGDTFKCQIGVFGPVRFDYAPISFAG